MTIRGLTSPAVMLVAAALALAAACGDDPDFAPPLTRGTPSPGPSAEPTQEPETIPWSEAVRLIADCDVTSVMQAHSLDVWLTLDDGSQRHTVEPSIDEVFAVVRDAVAGGCEQIPLATE